MVSFCLSYTHSIRNCCVKVNNIPSYLFMTSFFSKTEIKSSSRLSPPYKSWSTGLVKKVYFMRKTCSIKMESYTLLPKVDRKFSRNFPNKFMPQFQVIFAHDSFSMSMSSFQVSLLHKSTSCLLTN